MATQLADLLTYGFVGLADPVTAPAPLPKAATWWLADDACEAPDFHEVSPRLRSVVLTLGAPVADRRLLGAMVALTVQKSDATHNVISLPPPERHEDIAEHLTRGASSEVTRRAQMMRECRRQRLGLSANLSADEINAAIYTAYIVPVAEVAIAQLFNDKPQVRVSATPPPNHVIANQFAALAPQADDPLSDNVYALAMRTGFHSHTSIVMKPWLQLSPFHFGLKARRAKALTEVMQRAALSTPQLCLLSMIGEKGHQNTRSD